MRKLTLFFLPSSPLPRCEVTPPKNSYGYGSAVNFLPGLGMIEAQVAGDFGHVNSSAYRSGLITYGGTSVLHRINLL